MYICCQTKTYSRAREIQTDRNGPIGHVNYNLRRANLKSQFPKKTLHILDELKNLIPVLDVPSTTAKTYGSIRAQLENKGKTIGHNDLLFAAHAIALNLILATNNEKEFSRIQQLKIEN